MAKWACLGPPTRQKILLRVWHYCMTVFNAICIKVTCIQPTEPPPSPLEGCVAGVKQLLAQQGSSISMAVTCLSKLKLSSFPLYFCQRLNPTPLLIYSIANTLPREELASLEESREQTDNKGPCAHSCFPGKMATTILINTKAHSGHLKIWNKDRNKNRCMLLIAIRLKRCFFLISLSSWLLC